MKRCTLIPDGWPCSFAECPPGFFMFNKNIFLKSEYGGDEAYCESGEVFWGGTQTKEERAKLEVQPVRVHWEYYEE